MRLSIIALLLAGFTGPSVLPTATTAEAPTASPPPAPFIWPLTSEHQVTRPFEPPSAPYGPGHRGVDLAGAPGQAVHAAGDGLVVFAGGLAGRDLVSIEHDGGLRTTYEPVTAAVTAGQHVTQGQQIGQLQPGHPECTAAPPLVCLHWGARRQLDYLDPLLLLGHGHVRLLPWDN